VQRIWTDDRDDLEETVETDVPVFLAGARSGKHLVVRFKAVGPEFADASVHSVRIELQYADPPNRISHQGEVWIRALHDTAEWDVGIADPNARSYHYRLTVYHTTVGANDQPGPWAESSASIVAIPIVAA